MALLDEIWSKLDSQTQSPSGETDWAAMKAFGEEIRKEIESWIQTCEIMLE